MIYSSKKDTTSFGVIEKLLSSFLTGGVSTGISISMAGAAEAVKNLGVVLARADLDLRSDDVCLILENIAN